MQRLQDFIHDLLVAGAMSLGTAIRVASAAPLFTVVLVIAVTSGVFALRELWRRLGPPVKARGGSPAHYGAWLEVRSNAFENALRLYANPHFNDGGAEARHVLDLMNSGGAEPLMRGGGAEPPTRGGSMIVLVFVVVALLVSASLFLAQRQQTQEPAATALTVALTAAALQAPLAAAAPAGFGLSVDDGLYDGQRAALESDSREALAYVTQRFGSGPTSTFHAVFANDSSCNLNGVANTETRTVQTNTCNGIAISRAVAIEAHEFVHQLCQDRYGPAHLSADLMLAEGVATWGAGKYWLGDVPDFRTFVRSQRDSSVSYPLTQSYVGLGVAAHNAIYYQWAAFVEYLITTYGREKFDQVYVTGHGDPGSADYTQIYGKDIHMLEQDWKEWIRG